MKPLPAQDSSLRNGERRALSHLPSLQPTPPSPANFRRAGNPIQRAYPWLLLTSTGLSAAFCFLYISKPVVQASSGPAPRPAAEQPAKTVPSPSTGGMKLAENHPGPAPLLPGNQLPGESSAAADRPNRLEPSATEQTNLSVQHVLNAQIPAGDISRIILDVPVLYQSRHLRWNQGDVEEARELLGRLADHQERSSSLRAEATQILGDWNRLIARAIPSSDLRADSPSLPGNQSNAAPLNVPTSLKTSESIQLQPAGK